MRISKQQLEHYNETGYLFLPEYFTKAEINTIKVELPSVFAQDSLKRVLEKDGRVVRSVYGSHKDNAVFGRLVRHPKLVEPAMQIIGNEVYVYQFKINAKSAFDGDSWQWHQDYIFWLKEDGLPAPAVTNAVLFLDDVNEFNGPLYFIPSSHEEGMIEVPPSDRAQARGGERSAQYQDKPAWISNLTADLKYSLDKKVMKSLVAKHGIVAPKGPSGSVLFFHCNLIHGSSNNISPFDRTLVLISFNSVNNIPRQRKNPRPDFLVSVDHEPIKPLDEADLLL